MRGFNLPSNAVVGVRTAAVVIEEVHIVASPSLTNEKTVGIIVVIYCATNRLLGSQSVRAILIRYRSASFNRCRKLSSVPTEIVQATIIVRQGITDTVTANALSIKYNKTVKLFKFN